MKYLILILTMAFLTSNASAVTVPFMGSDIRFVLSAEAGPLLGSKDEFIRDQGSFDQALRMQSSEELDEAAYMDFLSSQALDWKSPQIRRVTEAIGQAEARLSEWGAQFDMPDEILLLLTSGKEEPGAIAYTRGEMIVFSAPAVSEDMESGLQRLFLHELFHVLSRHNPEIRKALYATAGFESCQAIDFPEKLLQRKLTNPDAHHFDAYISLEIEGESRNLMPLTLAKSAPWTAGDIFANLELAFLEVKVVEGACTVKGKPVLHPISSAPDYVARTGGNTGYIIHPEEIIADNFAMAMMGESEVPNPEVLSQIKALFIP